MEDLNTFCYLQEQTSFEDDYKGNFGYEVVDKGNRFYVKFPAVLQSFGVKNRNGREYESANVWDRIANDEQIQSLLKTNSWMGELDHPEPAVQGQELTLNRIAKADLKNTSHYIRSPRLNGDLLEANIQTDSSTDSGMNLGIKIVDGKIIPCFSARVLGSLRNKGGRAVVFVKKLITFDCVQYPSHPQAHALFNQPIQESVDVASRMSGAKIIKWPELARMATENDEAANFICESFGLSEKDLYGVTSTGNSVVLTENDKNVYIQPISDKFIRNKTKKMLEDILN